MYVGLKQPRGDGERYVTPARAAAKETSLFSNHSFTLVCSLYSGYSGSQENDANRKELVKCEDDEYYAPRSTSPGAAESCR